MVSLLHLLVYSFCFYSNANIVKSKKLRIHGVDIDHDYVVTCKENITKSGLKNQITVEHESIYDHQVNNGLKYNIAYFGASFMLMPDPVKCLLRVKSQVEPDASIFFTQTFQVKKFWLVDLIKPIMTWL